MIDFNLIEFVFDIQSNFPLILGSVIVGGIFLGALFFVIGAFIRFFINVISK